MLASHIMTWRLVALALALLLTLNGAVPLLAEGTPGTLTDGARSEAASGEPAALLASQQGDRMELAVQFGG